MSVSLTIGSTTYESFHEMPVLYRDDNGLQIRFALAETVDSFLQRSENFMKESQITLIFGQSTKTFDIVNAICELHIHRNVGRYIFVVVEHETSSSS